MKERATRAAVRASLLFTLLGVSWVLITDELGALWFHNPPDQARWRTYTSWAFVLLAACLLFLLLRRGFLLAEHARTQEPSASGRLADMLEMVGEAVIAVGPAQRIVVFNKSAQAVFGYQAVEVLGQPLDFLLPGEHGHLHQAQIAEFALSNDQTRRMGSRREMLGRRKDGTTFAAEGSVSKLSQNDEVLLVVLLTDISERKRAEAELVASETRYRALFDHLPVALYRTTPDGVILDANHALVQMLGYPDRETLLQVSTRDLFTDTLQRERELSLATQKQVVRDQELQLRRSDGSLISVMDHFHAVVDGSGAVKYYEGSLEDITERKRVEEKLRRLSTHDSLTGLYNRSFFEEEAARLARGREFPVTVVMADVDGLKSINDSQGHEAGDELLRRTADVLRASFRTEDVVARIGGDEFAVLLPATDAATARESLARVSVEVDAQNIAHDGPQLSISVGTATAQRGDQLGEAQKQADALMYRAKTSRRAAHPGDDNAG